MPKLQHDWLESPRDHGRAAGARLSRTVARWLDTDALQVVYFRLGPPGHGYARRRVKLGAGLPKDLGPGYRVVGVRSFTPPGRLLVSELRFEGARSIVAGRAVDPGVWHLGQGADPEFSEQSLTPESAWAYQGEPIRYARVDWGSIHEASCMVVEYRATTYRSPWLRMAVVLEPEPPERRISPPIEDSILHLAQRLPDDHDLLREASIQLRSLRHVEREMQKELARVLVDALRDGGDTEELVRRILYAERFVPSTVRRSYPELDALVSPNDKEEQDAQK